MAIAVSTHLVEGAGAPQTQTREFSALPLGIVAMVGWLQSQQIAAATMKGTSFDWGSPFDALAAAGIQLILVYAQPVKHINGRKTDVADSLWLARLCQFDLAMPNIVPDIDVRNLRSLCRTRRQEIAAQSRIRTRVPKIIDRTGVRIGGILTDIFGMNGRHILEELAPGLPTSILLEGLSRPVRNEIDQLGDALTRKLDSSGRLSFSQHLQRPDERAAAIKCLDDAMAKGLEPWPNHLRIRMTLPGISVTLAGEIFVPIGPDLSIFPSPDHLASGAGLCPGNNESGGKRRSSQTTSGNKDRKTALVECAHGASRAKGCQFEGYHRSLHLRRGDKKAMVATAHTMLRVIYPCRKTQTPYRDPSIDYDQVMVERNAPRWIRMITEFGFITAATQTKLAGVPL